MSNNENTVIESTLTPAQELRKAEFQPLKTIERIDFGNLDDAEEIGGSLVTTYWTPVSVGEEKRGTLEFFEVNDHEKIDEVTGEFSVLRLPVMVLLAYKGNKQARVSNGSKRLVAALEGMVKNGMIEIGRTPIKIIYLGKVKNSTNSKMSDSFDVIKLNAQAICAS